MQKTIYDLTKAEQEQLILYGHHAVMAGAYYTIQNIPFFITNPTSMTTKDYIQMLANLSLVLDCTDCILYSALEQTPYTTMMQDFQTLHDLTWKLTQFSHGNDNTCEDMAKSIIQSVCGKKSEEAFNYGKVLVAKSMASLGQEHVMPYLTKDCRKSVDERDLVMAVRADLMFYTKHDPSELSSYGQMRAYRGAKLLREVPFGSVAVTPLDKLCELCLTKNDCCEQQAVRLRQEQGAGKQPLLTIEQMWAILDGQDES